MIEDYGVEDRFIPRPPPPCPYTLTGAVLEISLAVLTATFDALARFTKRRLESCCFWYGTPMDKQRNRVQAIVIPAQRNTWGNYHVSSTAMAAVSQATRSSGLRNLAQIHTHPGSMVEHSAYDDLMANSRQALSLVLPRYGASICKWPSEIGVHEFQGEYWYRLSPGQAARRIVSIPDYGPIRTLDLRAR
ncbi:MAG: Mov34/MPN/PAD-1 family protein [Betaproteobacteria bacterium]|nr:Mov34/MPN/PAD-1 family protein [Betaproteobacteria bacterium]